MNRQIDLLTDKHFQEDAGMLYIYLIFYNFMNFDGFGGLPFLSMSEKVSESTHRYYCYIKKDTLAYLVGENTSSHT